MSESRKMSESNQIFDFNKISDSQFDSNVTLFIEKFNLNDLANEYFQNIKKDDKIRQNRKDKKKDVAKYGSCLNRYSIYIL